jgi:di/tricarboxylate transporter
VTPDIAICLTILLAASVLFAWERIRADVVALGIMLALIATRVLTPEQGVAGFASDTVLTILGLLILTASLAYTGVVDYVGRLMLKVFGKSSLLLGIMITSASVGAFISNTASTAFFIPVVMELAKRTRTSPSRYLLPLAFSSILTSSVTLISTSTNLVVSQVMTQYRMPSMGMFELAPVGIPIAIVGILYMWLLGQRLMPARADSAAEVEIGERNYLADVVVLPNSPLIGKAIGSTRLSRNSAIRVVKLVRDGEPRKTVRNSTVLKPNDRLVIQGPRAEILKVKEIPGVELARLPLREQT